MNAQGHGYRRAFTSTKSLVYFIFAIFLEYMYCIFVSTPLLVIKSYAKHPISISLIVVFLFPSYLIAQCFITAARYILNILYLSREQKYLFIFHFLFGHTHPLTAHLQQQEGMMRSDRADDMQKYMEGCSICFERKLDFCLEYCRDQFCTDCFQKYVTEAVNSSWGLSVTKIRCPVCKINIAQHEWAKYVPEAIIERYNKFNRPYRTFSRCCPHCETEMTPCDSLQYASCRSLSNEVALMLQSFVRTVSYLPEGTSWIRIFCGQEWRNSTLPHLHHRLIEQLKSASQTDYQLEQVKLISSKILQLEVRPESWKKLQFDHIFFFPNIQCSTCGQSFCLQCGENTHKELTCEDNMKQHVLWQQQQQISHGDTETLKWKLEFSRKCPCCSIMIHRDEGCNKVECTLCGFIFCWECRLPWSENCGYFVCATNKMNNASRSIRNMPESDLDRSELGVPNISNIFA
ncbi:hypothetical protein BD560DRAFT_393214 [Blakeslea trispora]|nr:hypothetical protein BD560DRAFT_393214 [Blakeslea trispora]